MRSAFRRATIAALVVAFLAPGLIHARTFERSSGRVNAASEASRDGGFLSAVWNLLTKLSGLAGLPSVSSDTMTPPPSTATTPPPPPPDNGGRLDPVG